MLRTVQLSKHKTYFQTTAVLEGHQIYSSSTKYMPRSAVVDVPKSLLR